MDDNIVVEGKYLLDTTRPSMQMKMDTEDLPIKTDQSVGLALFDYTAQRDKDLSFNKGEHLEIINDTEGDWWFARSKATKKEGYIPSNFVIMHKSIEVQPWYFGKINRIEAENKLLLPQNEHGAFLIRHAETRKNAFFSA